MLEHLSTAQLALLVVCLIVAILALRGLYKNVNELLNTKDKGGKR